MAKATTKPTVNRSEATRQGLQALGKNAPAKDVGRWVAEKYPEHKAGTEKKTYATEVSTARKAVGKTSKKASQANAPVRIEIGRSKDHGVGNGRATLRTQLHQLCDILGRDETMRVVEGMLPTP